MPANKLSESSRLILQAIADGSGYQEIVESELAQNEYQIFYAAAEALELLNPSAERSGEGAYHKRLAEIQAQNPKAYAPWTPEEEAQLATMVRSGESVKQIAQILQRQPSAIRSRLKKLGLSA